MWLAVDTGDMTARERAMIEVAETVVVSAVSIWEVRLKWNSTHVSGARKGIVDPADVLAAVGLLDFTLLPLTADHAAVTLDVPMAHRDPFDELLLAQAQAERLRLLTRDRELLGHPLAIGA